MKTSRSLFRCVAIAAFPFAFCLAGSPPLAAHQWEHLAGSNGGPGDRDRTGNLARFFHPGGVVVDSGGNTFVADHYNHTIRRVTPGGVVTTIAGQSGVVGDTDGPAGVATFTYPQGIAMDAAGVLYVSENPGHRIRTITFPPDGPAIVATLAGTGVAGSVDGPALSAQFSFPAGIAVTPNGAVVLVADYGGHTIRRITVATGVVDTVAGTADVFGSTDGPGATALFSQPIGLALSGNTLFVSEVLNYTIRALTPTAPGVDMTAAAFTVGTVAGSAGLFGSANGLGPSARFNYPSGIAVNAGGTSLAIVDTTNQLVREMNLGTAAVTTIAGAERETGSADGSGSAARFQFINAFGSLNGIAFDPSNGDLLLADSNNHTLRRIGAGSPTSVTTLAGRALVDGYYGFSAGNTPSPFSQPKGMAVDSAGAVYVADSGNHALWKITGGVPALLAGGPPAPGFPPLFTPSDAAVDSNLNVYVADVLNNRILLVTQAGAVSVFAGGEPGVPAGTDGLGAAAGFKNPQGLAVDAADNVWVADTGDYTVRMITPGGLVSTVAGQSGNFGSADGAALAGAQFQYPADLVVTPGGAIFVADNMNIRSITPPGAAGARTVATFAGTGTTAHVDGIGTAASFSSVTGLAMDAAGNLYAADEGSRVVRMITVPGAEVSSIGGRHLTIGNQGGPGAEAMFHTPHGIASLPDGTLYLSADFSHGVFIGTPAVTMAPVLVQPADGTLTKSPLVVEFTLPEAADSGSVALSFSDGANTFVLTLATQHESAGAHRFSFDPQSPPGLDIVAGSAVPDGLYTVTVSYRDAQGSPSAGDSGMNVKIDTTPPDTTITDGPPASIPNVLPMVFEFASNEANVTFKARRDSHPFADGSSPQQYFGVSAGAHTFEVYAVDEAGNVDPTPAIHNWTCTPTSIGTWREQRFGGNVTNAAIAGDPVDPDGDGIPNLLEYGAGSDPLEGTSAPLQEWKLEGGAITLIHDRSLSATDAVFGMEVSRAFGGWVNASFSEMILSDDGVIQRVKVTVPTGENALPAGKGFVRAKVSVAP